MKELTKLSIELQLTLDAINYQRNHFGVVDLELLRRYDYLKMRLNKVKKSSKIA